MRTLSARIHIVLIALAMVFLLACGGGGSGGGGGSYSSTLTWIISDQCVDGRGTLIRFFDRTDGGFWPGSGGYYSMNAGDTRQVTLSCDFGNKICYGARTDPYDGGFWGLDVNGNQSCSNCCTTCDGDTVRKNLGC